jgi:GT2 family glycosyltransferase
VDKATRDHRKPARLRREAGARMDDSSTIEQHGAVTTINDAGAPLRIAFGIATVGRPGVLIQILAEVRNQYRPPDAILVCAPSVYDVAGVPESFPDVRLIFADRGLTRQRNEILHNLDGFDVVVFIDDDFVPSPRYLASIEAVFATQPAVAMTTGLVVADGICGPGMEVAQARKILRLHYSATHAAQPICDVYNAYGCNMGLRLEPIRAHGLAFDEYLPLYAWQEDVDFSRRLACHGRIVRVPSALGVHLGVKLGRQSGVRFGYSQVANPVYLMRKGTYSYPKALHQIARNLLANFARSFWPEPYIDRQGRAVGNVRAMLDLVVGRLNPSRILSL